MAGDYPTFFGDDEALIEEMSSVNIRAVTALAPTDKEIDGEYPHLHNVSYLVLQGARDADITDFRGDRQFYRTTFGQYEDGFKAALYIGDANHAQFNTSWGRLDQSLPRGLFLNQQETMVPEAQRQIAKVYVSAFMERIFHGEMVYDKLFQDYRHGRDWLPDTALISQHQHAYYRPLVQFDRGKMIDLNVEGFANWEVTTPEDRKEKALPADALKLEWRDKAAYTIDLSQNVLETAAHEPAKYITLTMANVDAADDGGRLPDIDVELETVDGLSVRRSLDEFGPIPPVIKTDFTHFGLFDSMFRDGKYSPAWEPIFQTIDLPLEAFTQADPAFDPTEIASFTLHFHAPSGKILLQEVGVW
ncbi:hypothetical protein JNUCC1_00737 [Lentibacillus sp. JNUCC-1]|nr:hypothetical protein [Lentibacillus sp. JNUCC-1]